MLILQYTKNSVKSIYKYTKISAKISAIIVYFFGVKLIEIKMSRVYNKYEREVCRCLLIKLTY
nr:MAG TPA: hypothetical protein [Caudoviricetes sp.]